VSDIFREVEEDVRRERLEKLWKQYGDYIIAAVSVIVIGVAGYKLWQHYDQQQRLKASTEYQAAMQLSDGGSNTRAAQAFAQIAKHAPSGYAALAQLSQADAMLASGNISGAVSLYMTVAKKDNGGLGDLARIRAAWAQAETLSVDDLQKLLAPLLDSKSSWQYMAREIMAYRDFHDGRLMQAQSAYDLLAVSSDAPAGLRQRARAMATLIRAGGVENYGTVPKPVAPGQAGGQQGNANP
jgi:hypothetical protein